MARFAILSPFLATLPSRIGRLTVNLLLLKLQFVLVSPLPGLPTCNKAWSTAKQSRLWRLITSSVPRILFSFPLKPGRVADLSDTADTVLWLVMTK